MAHTGSNYRGGDRLVVAPTEAGGWEKLPHQPRWNRHYVRDIRSWKRRAKRARKQWARHAKMGSL